MKTLIYALSIVLFTSLCGQAQTITQTLTGQVLDKNSQEPLPFATIIVLHSHPVIGTTTDIDGNFKLKNVPVGRHAIQISMVGYETNQLNELLISSTHNAALQIALTPKSCELGEAIIRVRKETPLNTMTTVSSRQFTVEETQRYAGGLNDPARLASSYAGIATPSVSSNGISIRGNSPNGLLWRVQGVEVPNPSHFANLSVIGGGMITAISNQMMTNSDFHTGAFPAEFGNATSGVFDIRMRKGNQQERQHTFQAGLIGIDFSTEGPFVKGKKASYLINYRNSTMALLAPILPDNTGILKYQDLAFNTYFPTTNKGSFSFWGISALDGQQMDARVMEKWEMDADRDNSKTSLYMYASGLTHQLRVGKKSLLKTTVAATGSGFSHEEDRIGLDQLERPQSDIANNRWRLTLKSSIKHQFTQHHRNHSGVKLSHLGYRVDINQSQTEGEAPIELASQQGNSGLLQVYSQSHILVTKKLTLNAGVNLLYFMLNDNLSLEPRLGLKYQMNNKQSFAFAYGLHSRVEHLPLYFVKKEGSYPNKSLDLMKSAHYVLSYNQKLTSHLRLSLEPYYQRLTQVPVSPESYISSLNFREEVFFHEALENSGTGYNAGIDITVEHFMNKGYYYLATASLFNSKYKGADNIERNTRYNRNFVINLLTGKEWQVGKDKNNLLSANMRINYMGGNRKAPIHLQASLAKKEVIYAESPGNRAFSEQYPNQTIVSFTLSYRINKVRHASVWSIQVINALGTEEFNTDFYNIKTGSIETKYAGIMIPELSYKIKF
ncbi:MAG: TonB-dependent receptor [Bacteroidota bacterium]